MQLIGTGQGQCPQEWRPAVWLGLTREARTTIQERGAGKLLLFQDFKIFVRNTKLLASISPQNWPSCFYLALVCEY